MAFSHKQTMAYRCSLAALLSLAISGIARAEDPIFKDSFESGTACWWSLQDHEAACPPNAATGFVSSSGGSVELPGIATITIPSGAFSQDTEVSVEELFDAGVAGDFFEFTSMFQTPGPVSALVVIDTGTEPPISDTVEVVLHLSDSLLDSIPTGQTLQLFAMVLQEGGQEALDVFDAFTSVADTDQKTLTATLPTAFFARGRLVPDSHYRAILVLSTTEDGAGLQSNPVSGPDAVTACEGAPVSCPLVGGCTVTSRFSPARSINGTTRPHHGTDFRALVGMTVVAPAAGVVERSYSSTSYGETIIIRHSDGSATLLAHLSSRNVHNGDTVTSGQTIGLSGNTGRSTGPHLHMEYVASGPIIQSPHRVDPEDCLEVESCTGPNCECCLESQGCQGETGCACGIGCCCCPLYQACSSDLTQGCVAVTNSCSLTDRPFDAVEQFLKPLHQ